MKVESKLTDDKPDDEDLDEYDCLFKISSF